MGNKIKHTPGPWHVTEHSDWQGMSGVSLGIDDRFGAEGGRDYSLATVVHGDPDELQANACLIAAAPALLAALERLAESELASMEEREYPHAEAYLQARAAIAAARGES